MNLEQLKNSNISRLFAVPAAVTIALFVGYLIGTGEHQVLIRLIAVVCVLVYVVTLRPYTWVIGLLICFTDFLYAPFGFMFSTVDITLGMGLLLFGATWWLKPRIELPSSLESHSIFAVKLTLLLWAFYVGGHLLFNVYEPYRPEDYAFKNLIKSYVAFAAPQIVILYFIHRPTVLRVSELFPYRIGQCVWFGLFINIGIRIYQLATGNYDMGSGLEEDTRGYFHIPYIELFENMYALRNLTPFAAVFSCAFIYTRWFTTLRHRRQLLILSILPFSVVGAAISGGRATLLFVVALVAGILALKKRFGLLICGGAALLLFVVFANVLSSELDKVPRMIQRSIAWAVIEGAEDAKGGIAHSTDWRKRLFFRALDEWRSDPRIFWFGRGTYAYGVQDYVATIAFGREEAMIASSLRRGATHNLITDLLVIFGVVGLVLFVFTVFAVIGFLWNVVRNPAVVEVNRQLALVALVWFTFSFIYGLFGGGAYPPLMAWVMLMLVSALYQLRSPFTSQHTITQHGSGQVEDTTLSSAHRKSSNHGSSRAYVPHRRPAR